MAWNFTRSARGGEVRAILLTLLMPQQMSQIKQINKLLQSKPLCVINVTQNNPACHKQSKQLLIMLTTAESWPTQADFAFKKCFIVVIV